MRNAWFVAALVLCFLGTAAAQVSTPVFSGPAYSFGLVTVSTMVSARLNVVNTFGVATALPVAATCNVELSFWGPDGKMIGTATTVKLDPGKGATQSLPATTATQIRAQVRIMPSPVATSGPGMPVRITACSVVPTLEVFHTTGSDTIAILQGSPLSGGVMTLLPGTGL